MIIKVKTRGGAVDLVLALSGGFSLGGRIAVWN